MSTLTERFGFKIFSGNDRVTREDAFNLVPTIVEQKAALKEDVDTLGNTVQGVVDNVNDATEAVSGIEQQIGIMQEQINNIQIGGGSDARLNFNTVSDCNAAYMAGFYYITPTTTNAPVTGQYLPLIVVGNTSSGAVLQIAGRFDTGKLWARSYSGSAWNTWVEIVTSSSGKAVNAVLADAANSLSASAIANQFSHASFTANSWQQFPSGLMIQWGSYNSTSDGVEPFSFPTSFNIAALGLAIAGYPSYGLANIVSKAQFSIDRADDLGNISFFMIAVGY